MNIIASEDDIDVLERIEISEKTPEVLVCVYGTLREGEGNWARCLARTNSVLLGTFRSDPKFTMYGRRAGFPILVDRGNTSIVYEVWKVTEEDILENIHSLEGCTGIPGNEDNWYDIMSINTPVGKGWIYVQHDFKGSEESAILTGDWKNKSV